MRFIFLLTAILPFAAAGATLKRASTAPLPVGPAGLLTISNGPAMPDGYAPPGRTAILVNGATPGPLVRGYKVAIDSFPFPMLHIMLTLQRVTGSTYKYTTN